MNFRQISLLTLAIISAVAIGGCPQPPDGNGDGDGTLPPATLSDAQNQAIDAVAQQLTAFAPLLGTFSELADEQLTISTLPLGRTFGECPVVSFLAPAELAAIAFDFKEGCSTDQTGGKTVTGGLDIRITRASGQTAVTLLDLTIDGVAMSGAMQFTLSRDGSTVTLAGEITETIEITGGGSISGSLTMEVNTSGLITITTANLTFNDGTSSQAVALSNVVIDPAGNGNFVPQSGTATFSITEDGSTTALAVEFTSTTPSNGGVDVTVDGAAGTTATIPLP